MFVLRGVSSLGHGFSGAQTTRAQRFPPDEKKISRGQALGELKFTMDAWCWEFVFLLVFLFNFGPWNVSSFWGKKNIKVLTTGEGENIILHHASWSCFCCWYFYGVYHGKSASFTTIWEKIFAYFFQASNKRDSLPLFTTIWEEMFAYFFPS